MDFEKAINVVSAFEGLSASDALAVLGMCIDITAVKNKMTGPECLDFMRPHVEAVYEQFGDYELARIKAE